MEKRLGAGSAARTSSAVKMPRWPGSRRGSVPERAAIPAGFIHVDVGGLIEQHGVAGFGVGANGDLIRHGAGGDVDGVFYS